MLFEEITLRILFYSYVGSPLRPGRNDSRKWQLWYWRLNSRGGSTIK